MSYPLCLSLDDVRSRIDAIDRRLVALIAERGAYVTQAAAFKRSDAEVAAPDRVAQVLARVDALAAELGADPRVVEATWRSMIGAFIEAWERGTPIIAAIKKTSEESGLMWWLRSAYYKWLRRMSSTELIEHFTGFGLYDRDVIEAVREIGDAYPYMRGLISELGFPLERVEFDQPLRKRGITTRLVAVGYGGPCPIPALVVTGRDAACGQEAFGDGATSLLRGAEHPHELEAVILIVRPLHPAAGLETRGREVSRSVVQKRSPHDGFSRSLKAAPGPLDLERKQP